METEQLFKTISDDDLRNMLLKNARRHSASISTTLLLFEIMRRDMFGYKCILERAYE